MKAQVLLPKIFNYTFTYESKQNSIQVGDFVEVPFGKNKEVVTQKVASNVIDIYQYFFLKYLLLQL